MDYKAEYERIMGRPWPFEWEPVSGPYDEMKAWLLAVFGPHEVRTLPNGSTQYIWRAPTRKELQTVIDDVLAEPHDGEEG